MTYFSRFRLKNILGAVINPATEDKQDDIISSVDGVESKLDTSNTHLTNIEGYTDGIETGIALTNSTLGEVQATPTPNTILGRIKDIYDSVSSIILTNIHTNTKELIVASKGHICIDNSTSTPLGINGIFTGGWQDTLDYSEIIVSVGTDKPSITNGLQVLWSADGININGDDVFTISANADKTFTFPCQRRYVKIMYTNDGTAQTVFNLSVLLKRYASKGSSHRLADTLNQEDDAIVCKSLIAGKTTAGGGAIVDVKVNPSGALTVEATISSSALPTGAATSDNQTNGNQLVNVVPMARDLSGRMRVGSLTTLFDGKILNQEDTFLWDTKGTGTATFINNKVNLSVTSGQYLIRQAKHFCPYFSGKPQLIETTYDNFVNQANVVKRVGYFSSNEVAPYDSNKDGIWIEADGTTYRLICSRDGTETFNIPWTSWDGYSLISSYDWSKFTVNQIDFLWLGGAGVRLFLVIDGVFRLVHTIDNHAGYNNDLIIKSPNQPIRYEIRSTTGTGSLISICSQVASEGSQSEEGKAIAIVNTTPIACNAIGTIYAIKSIKKTAANRNLHIDISYIGGAIVSVTADAGLLMLILNPTISAPIAYANNSRISEGTPTNQTITAGTGRILSATQLVSNGKNENFELNSLRSLPVGIDDTMGEYVLAYSPYTINQNLAGVIGFTEY